MFSFVLFDSCDSKNVEIEEEEKYTIKVERHLEYYMVQMVFDCAEEKH